MDCLIDFLVSKKIAYIERLIIELLGYITYNGKKMKKKIED